MIMVSALGFEPWPGEYCIVFSTRVFKWVPANLMLGVTLRWTSIPSRIVEIFLVASCYRETGTSAGLIGQLARRQTFFDYSTMFIWKGLVEGWNDDILTMAESGGQTRDEPAENASKRPQTPWNDKEYDRKAWKVNFIHKTFNFTYCKANPLQTLVNPIFVTQRTPHISSHLALGPPMAKVSCISYRPINIIHAHNYVHSVTAPSGYVRLLWGSRERHYNRANHLKAVTDDHAAMKVSLKLQKFFLKN